jgi:hypothetical protein
VIRWGVELWPVTVVDVCAGGVAEYIERVEHWARSVRKCLDTCHAG